MAVNNVAIKVVHPSNDVITVLFNDQYCCYFSTGLNNDVMITIANKLVLSILFSGSNNREQLFVLHQC